MNNKRVVVILGSGRSGSSLIMQLLRDLGMVVSEHLTKGSVANPLGPFEDEDIFNLQLFLIRELCGNAITPMPEGWIESSTFKKTASALEVLMTNRLEQSAGIFGFKDPKTSMLIPLWVRVFNNLKLVPTYILCVRDPVHMAVSFATHYNTSANRAELIWLVRTVEALYSTAADCFIAHYEDWFVDPQPLAQSLLHYSGLDIGFKGDLSQVLATNIKHSLNRASHHSYEIQNPYVIKLYAALMECHGADFDRGRLMSVVKECRQAMDGFKGWYQLAHQANQRLDDMKVKLEKASNNSLKMKTLETRIKELEMENQRGDQLVTQIKKLQRQLDQLMELSNE